MNILFLELPILLLSVVANISIGLLVYFRNTDSWTNRLFALLNTAWIGWTVSTYLSLDQSEFQIHLVRLSMAFVVLMNTVFYFFVRIFPSSSTKLNKRQQILIAFSVIVAALALSPLLFVSVELTAAGASVPEPGPAIVLFVVHALITVVGSLSVLVQRLHRSEGALRSQLQFIMLGTILFFTIVPLTNFIFPLALNLTDLIIFSPVAPLIFAGFIGYTIVRHRLFDVRLIVARSAAYVLLLASLSAIYATVLFGVSSLFLEGSSYSGTEQVLNIVAAIVLAFTFQPLKRFFDHITNSIFYRDAYNSEAVIRQINDVILSSLALDGLLFGVARTLKEELRVQHVVAQIKQVKNVSQTLVTTNDINFSESDMNYLHRTLSNFDKRMIVSDELDSGKLKKMLRSYDIDLIARIVADPDSNDDGLGFIALGPKRSGSLYTNKDITLLDLIASELVVAVQNALRFEEISQFNEQLSARVDSATSELRDKNKKLKKLDHAKDDFISMASHQLRTPLTTIKGYLSMLSDGDIGELDEKQQQVVESAFASSERMVYLISDLLNASRINTGKFVIEKKPVKLKSVIENEIKQLGITAEARDIEIVAELGEKDPVLNLDANKLKQVIMNFIDNAIYYSEQGSKIIVNYNVTADAVELRIKDTGIGVPQEARNNLFTKFYRAENAKRVRPDGTGLGLFLAKKVVTAQGGSIIFESEMGEGSTFGFRFALSAVATNEEPAD